ncbi:MAG: hypothetical protein COV01_01435 [Candidatus Taylorbacteria bacterium CG10_big_fil_rev_8_21_14_0_10_41_48]|uniref:Uncharacterized protein n=1 Tax=Candidatus Taylorbacteria bacterium CG10_big_fil_rev_8_21_14_0_10_41_48 TaxID=1975024 RepID=A0A2M8LCU6_9BACT|nr:MAG: hypothetical protein COV01_01435 [Candidatus Taylorbacteria bacterium CG10_big_fil_rev_8_21_14_0_10_41_48]
MGFEKPEKVRKAQQRADTEALRKMGSVGGRKTAERNDINREHAKRVNEKSKLEEWNTIVASNEHILTPDGEDPEEMKDATH